MAKPIAQTFYINEPIDGVEGVMLTKVEIYFQSVSSTLGVELQIRTTDNGEPTDYRLPNASKLLAVTDRHPNNQLIIGASNDASRPTIFEFDTPIPLQSMTSYALVIIPAGGNPDYKVWTAELSAKDVLTNTPINVNNETGDLFLASNDRSFTPIINEDIKFNLYIANFTQNSGQAVFELDNFENIHYYSQTKPFIRREPIFMSEVNYDLAKLNISSNTGAFTTDEVIYQSNGSANVATGKVYGANSTVIRIANSVGTWSNTYQVSGATSSANAVVSLASQNVISYSNTTVTPPFTDVFSVNQMIYVGTNDRYDMVTAKVTAVNSTAITTSAVIPFTDNDCLIGKLRGGSDADLVFGTFDGLTTEDPTFLRNQAVIMDSRGNGTANFSNSTGCYIIGVNSRASAICYNTADITYNAVAPDYAAIDSKSTDLQFSFNGVQAKSLTYDTSPTALINNYEVELTDKSRSLMSRSNEYALKDGNTTFRVYADFSTANNKFSPYIGLNQRRVNFFRNFIPKEENLSGYILNLTDFNNFQFIEQQNVTQNNGSYSISGTVYFANSSFMYVGSNSNYSFQSSNTVYVTTNTAINAVVTSTARYAEIYNDSVHPNTSRYISKSVILADKQDAEDLRCYLSAYRPARTNLLVYSKIVNAEDPEAIKDKYWSRMVEMPESTLLLSSGTNRNDFVELVYDFPVANEIFAMGVGCNNNSANVTLTTTNDVNQFDYIYLHDVTNNKFIVRQVTEVANNTTLIIDKAASFDSANCRFGTIPGLEHATGAFVLPDNFNIVRYVSNSDVVYDGFKTFKIKIVPVSESNHLVPRADDMRCLALQV